MFKTGTIAAILAFCSIASAAPANRRDESRWAKTDSGSHTTPSIHGTATGWAPHEASSSSHYHVSLSYFQTSSTAEEAVASATGDIPAPTANTESPTAAPTGLSKVQQILLSDTRADAVNNILKDDSDFVFDFNRARKFGPGQGGEVVLATRKAFPALTGTGIGMAVGFLGPCGFNTPHVHNRAAELLVVVKGKVASEMVVENGVENADKKPRDIMNTIEELQATPYYTGALHTQFNPTCDDATFIAPLSSDDFGANTIAQAYLALGDETIRAAAGNHIEGADVDKFRGIISAGVALGVEQCLETCGIAKR
ncbi:RmlC-like cupin domain-containing protein [Daldinia vernicosa]|uniref:RmlC-like cupin domain-containing protein n=1 Tax=Daldinia vernicosa TaxID=114800 RepID=UPI002008B214|nr:RmlC-like cupin domain-containing protein [Daldinia vernicosa]KAI0845567.1 RmlC-like cupin domain-containing protein [Daldinia vernicosa]